MSNREGVYQLFSNNKIIKIIKGQLMFSSFSCFISRPIKNDVTNLVYRAAVSQALNYYSETVKISLPIKNNVQFEVQVTNTLNKREQT